MVYEKEVVENTINFVKKELQGAEGGHDWWHIYRVWNLSKNICLNEKADLLIVELSALLHDIADSKFNNGDEEIGPKKAKEFLLTQNLQESVIEHVEKIIKNISFKNSFDSNLNKFSSIELQIVQDADRLDAIGAIGVARTFNFGGFKQRELYNPNVKPNLKMSKEEYKNSNSPTINHFYEKLLLLKDKMNTKTGKDMAQKRHEFMELFLEEFYLEWDGKR